MFKNLLTSCLFLAFLFSTLTASQTPTNVRAVVFDFGGVIATTDRTKIINFLSDTFQLTESELTPLLKQWKQVLVEEGDERKFWESYAQSIGLLLPNHWFDDFERITGFSDIPGMIPIVRSLQEQGYLTPMLSNIQEYQANIIRRFDYYDADSTLKCDI